MQHALKFGAALRLTVAAAAVAAAFGLRVTPAGVQWSAAQAQEAVRAEVGKPLQAARDLFKQGKYKEALAKVREAEAVPNRNAAENHLIEQMRAAVASQAGDTEQAIKSSQALIASGKLSEATVKSTSSPNHALSTAKPAAPVVLCPLGYSGWAGVFR